MTGCFQWVALHLTRKSRGNGLALFLLYYTLSSILTIFTSNDVSIMALTVCKRGDGNCFGQSVCSLPVLATSGDSVSGSMDAGTASIAHAYQAVWCSQVQARV
jgi:hypothetical protein